MHVQSCVARCCQCSICDAEQIRSRPTLPQSFQGLSGVHSHCTSTCADEYLIQFLVLPFALHRNARNVSFPFFPALLWLDRWRVVSGQVTLRFDLSLPSLSALPRRLSFLLGDCSAIPRVLDFSAQRWRVRGPLALADDVQGSPQSWRCGEALQAEVLKVALVQVHAYVQLQ